MAGPLHCRRRSLLVAVLLLLATGLAVVAAADGRSDSEEGGIKISVRYPSAEDSAWLDRWAAKYERAPPGSGAGHGDFSITPATDEESAHLNRMFANAKKRAAGYDGRIEFDHNDRPRIVVDAMHHRSAAASKMGEDDLGSQGNKARFEDL